MAMSTEKKVGLFFLLALVALGAVIELVEDWSPFEDQTPYLTYFDSGVGIKVGDPVLVAGVDVGKVESVAIEKGKVRIDFYVVEGTDIREDSIASIRKANLLGGQFLGIDFDNPESPPLPPGKALRSRPTTNIDQLINNIDRNKERLMGNLGDFLEESKETFTDAVRQLESVVRKIDQGEGSLGRMVNDPALYDDLHLAVGSLKTFLDRLENGEGSLGRLLKDPTLYDEASATLVNLREISDRMKKGEGTIGRLLVEDDLYVQTGDAMAEIRELAVKVNEGKGTLGKLVNEDGLYDDASAAMQKVNSIAGKIDEGQGTLGKLVNEDGLYRDAKTTINKVEKTVDGLSDSGPLQALGVAVGTLF